MMMIFYKFLEDIVEVFMDEFSVYGLSFEIYLANLEREREGRERVLERCAKAGVVLN